MAFTYNGHPFASPATEQSVRDTIRFLVQDTDENAVELADSEIDGLYSNNANDVYRAAIEACVILRARYTRRATKSVGDLSISLSDIANGYDKLKLSLKEQSLAHNSPKPYMGGMRVDDRNIDAEDTDMVQPSVRVGEFDSVDSASEWSPTWNRS